MQPLGRGHGFSSQGGGEFDRTATFRLDVKDRSAWHGDAQHLLQAQGLGAELNIIIVPLLPLATFVLDREWNVGTVRLWMKLHHIRLADESQLIGAKPHRMDFSPVLGLPFHRLVRALVGQRTRERVGIVGPHILDAVQGAAALAVEEVVQSGEGRVVVGGVARGLLQHDDSHQKMRPF